MKLIVGLGNPGSRYEKTRHNIGFMVIDRLIADRQAVPLHKTSFEGLLFKTSDALLLKPQTFMNLSGKSVAAVQRFYKIEPEAIIVVHDDIDLPFGAVRFKRGGGHGGHNGLKSIDAAVGKAYVRVRVGVDKPGHKAQVASYVLQPFSDDEMRCLDALIDHVAKATEALITVPLAQVQTEYTLKSIEALCS